MSIEEVDTPCLLLDLDAFDRNVARMARFASQAGLKLRPHAKTHKSPCIANRQIAAGAVGVCCQKVSEAEAMVYGGVRDVLIANEVVTRPKIERLAALATQARVLVCVDDIGNVGDLNAAAGRFGVNLEVLVEIDVGDGRCGAAPGEQAVALAQEIDSADHLRFAGLQAYRGGAQHIVDYGQRKDAIDKAVGHVLETTRMLSAKGLTCGVVTGAGTGTYRFEAASGVYTELQSGSYIFMDADYGRVGGQDGPLNEEFEHSLFVYTAVMSKAKTARAVCDAGLKAHSIDSGLPTIYGREDIEYVAASDEHGNLSDPDDVLRLGEKLRLIPGHCDPTVNLYDNYVVLRDGYVVALWPVPARGMSQ